MNRIGIIGFFRALSRHRLYAILNIGGLGVGIAVFIVLGLFVRFETSFEEWLPDNQNIYLVESMLRHSGQPGPIHGTPPVAWEQISRDLPGTLGTRLSTLSGTVLQGGVGVPEKMALVDPDFLKVLPLPVTTGSASLADPTSILISERLASKYFGSHDAAGKPLAIVIDGKQHAYRVAAVFKNLPANTDFDFDLIARLVPPTEPDAPNYDHFHHWNFFGASTYVRMDSPEAARRFEEQLAGVVARHVGSDFDVAPSEAIQLRLQPITKVHFERRGSALTVSTLGVVGAFTLLIAIVNYINLATARGGLRAREVAMRKVLGATRASLIRQFMGEAIATSAIAAFVGLLIAEAGIPLVNAASGLNIRIAYFGSAGILLPLVVLTILIGAAAGIYPALILSRFPAAAVLASARSPGGGRAGARVREMLVSFQFALAIAFLIGTSVLYAQTRHVRTADVGFQRDNLMVVTSFGSASLSSDQRAQLLHLLGSLPGVTKASVSNSAPADEYGASTDVKVPGLPGTGPALDWSVTTPGFFDVIGARVLAGRVFDLAHPGEATGGKDFTSRHFVVINRAALTPLNFSSPQDAVGKTVGGAEPRTIIGVVEDMRFGTPRETIQPAMYEFKERDPEKAKILLRFSGNPKDVTDAARDTWLKVAPGVPFVARTAAQGLARYYEADDRAADLFFIGAGLAIVIGCIGLWGLASFNTARRVKEIGIRKTLGASSGDIVRLLVGQFLRPVLLANVVGWPLAWLAMRAWLAGFDDRIALSPLFFVAATAITLAIAVLTVLSQSLRAARAAPSWALRHD